MNKIINDVEDAVVISESLSKEMCGESVKNVKINDSDIRLLPPPYIFEQIEPDENESVSARILKMLHFSREFWRKKAIEERKHMRDIEKVFRMLWNHEYRRLPIRVQIYVKKISDTSNEINMYDHYRPAYISANRFHDRMSKIHVILENKYNCTYSMSDIIHMNTNKYYFTYKFGRKQ